MRGVIVLRGANPNPGSDPNPNPYQVYKFLHFASGYRRRASLQSGLKMRGLCERTLVQHVSALTKHVFPTLYPRMVDTSAGGMGRDLYRAFGNDLLSAVRNFFCEAGQEELGLQVQRRLLAAEVEEAAVAAKASHATLGRALVEGLFDRGAPGRGGVSSGGVSSAAAAAALAEGRAAAEGRRAQTARPQTREHAVPRDLELMADVAVSVPFSRNAALVADAYVVAAVSSGLRPTSAGLLISFGFGFALGLWLGHHVTFCCGLRQWEPELCT